MSLALCSLPAHAGMLRYSKADWPGVQLPPPRMAVTWATVRSSAHADGLSIQALCSTSAGTIRWRQAPKRMTLAKLGCGFDASGGSFVSCNVAECNGSGQADSEATDSMPELWDSFSVYDAVQQGRVLDLSIQLSKLWYVFLSSDLLFLQCVCQQQDFCEHSALMTNCCVQSPLCRSSSPSCTCLY